MRVLVVSGYGINCEEETLHAFIEVGFKGSIVHVNDLIENPKMLIQFQVLSFPGGFSYGDDTGSGNAMANKIRNNLFDHLSKFLMKDFFLIYHPCYQGYRPRAFSNFPAFLSRLQAEDHYLPS